MIQLLDSSHVLKARARAFRVIILLGHSPDGGERFGEVKVHLSGEYGRHDELGAKDANLGLQNVGHDVKVVLARDDDVVWILSGRIQLFDFFHLFPTLVLHLAPGRLHHQL